MGLSVPPGSRASEAELATLRTLVEELRKAKTLAQKFAGTISTELGKCRKDIEESCKDIEESDKDLRSAISEISRLNNEVAMSYKLHGEAMDAKDGALKDLTEAQGKRNQALAEANGLAKNLVEERERVSQLLVKISKDDRTIIVLKAELDEARTSILDLEELAKKNDILAAHTLTSMKEHTADQRLDIALAASKAINQGVKDIADEMTEALSDPA